MLAGARVFVSFSVPDTGHYPSLEAAQPRPGAGAVLLPSQRLSDPVLHLSSVGALSSCPICTMRVATMSALQHCEGSGPPRPSRWWDQVGLESHFVEETHGYMVSIPQTHGPSLCPPTYFPHLNAMTQPGSREERGHCEHNFLNTILLENTPGVLGWRNWLRV